MLNIPIFNLTTSGLTFEDGKLTLNFHENVHAEKLEDGLYVNPNNLGNGADLILDEWTVKEYSKNADERTIIGINQDVVPCIYTISRKKVTTRTSVSAYATSDTTKTVTDVMNEFNAVMDSYRTSGQAVPDGLPHTSYVLKPGDFFQFRENARPFVTPKVNDVTWNVAIDDANRYESDPIKAFFYVGSVEYNDADDPYYMTKLVLYCMWSTLDGFAVGQTYTATKS